MQFNYRTEYNRYRRYFTQLEPLVKTPVARAYFSLIASLLALSFFGAFAIRPTVKTIIGLQKEIADARFTNNKLQEKINALSEAQTQYSLVQTEVPIVLAALPKKPEFSTLLKQIENIAVISGSSISGMQFQSVVMFDEIGTSKETPQKPKSLEGAKTASVSGNLGNQSLGMMPISFSVVLRGTYDNIYAFLTSLSHLSRIISIKSYTIAGIQGGIIELALSIQSDTYFYE